MMWNAARLPCLVLAAAALLGACSDNAVPSAASRAAASKANLERGKYLTEAADCVACHTSAEGAPFAGGYALQSPYGPIYGTNITPDKQTGIGSYTADDLFRALHDGRTASGKYLYAAMPYTSYRLLTREDSDAIYAYLMSLPPVQHENTPTDLRWPYNWRWTLGLWNVLFRDPPGQSTEGSAAWQRGRYVVDALGHCGECHTPRNFLGAMQWSKALSGGILGHFEAPDITPQGLAARGWTPDALKRYLSQGIAPQGSAFDEMFLVIHHSTQYLSDADLNAATTFLLGDPPRAALPVKAQPIAPEAQTAGRRIYLDVCAGCHGLDGEGKPHVTVAIQGNSTVRQENPQNLIRAVLLGLPEVHFPGLERRQAMPGFAGDLSDAEIAALANYLRASWGGKPADVTVAAVAAYRH
jgi:mono/diheme cytochrome c family protein